MDYFCDVCDKTNKNKSKSEQLQKSTHNEIGNCIQKTYHRKS